MESVCCPAIVSVLKSIILARAREEVKNGVRVQSEEVFNKWWVLVPLLGLKYNRFSSILFTSMSSTVYSSVVSVHSGLSMM